MCNKKFKEIWQDPNQLLKTLAQKEDPLEKVEGARKSNLKHKSFLIITKYIPHTSAFMYILYTFGLFAGIDMFILGYLINYSVFTWIYFYLISFVFRYCYVHRLPLYYILINEILTTLDYYINIPVSELNLILIHIVLVGILIFGYSIYYKKYKLK